MKCIECKKEISENDKWCSMECKEKTFIENFEESQWTYKLIKSRTDLLLKKVEANLLFPFERTLVAGKEMERPKIADMLRLSMNKITREFT